jgi:hypothetical protein
MALIFSLSHQSRLPVDMPSFFAADKLCHFLAYGVLAFALWLSFVMNRHRLIFVPALVISCLYGLSDEIHQLYVPGRSFEWLDIAADCSGAFFTLLLLCFIGKYRTYYGQLKDVTKASAPGRVRGM